MSEDSKREYFDESYYVSNKNLLVNVVEWIGGDNYEFTVTSGGDRVGESRLSDSGSLEFSISWVYTYARHSVKMRFTIITIPCGAY